MYAVPTADHLAQAWRMFPHTFMWKASRWTPGGAWTPYRHLLFTLDVLARELERGNARVIVNMPPRHGKSFTLSKWLPLWFLSNNPYKRVLLAAYEKDIATSFCAAARDEAQTNPLVGLKVSPRRAASDLWATVQGGHMMAAGVGTGITGRGMNLGLIDDPIKDWKQAHSETQLTDIWDWYRSTFYTRLEPGGSVVINMTRWVESDLVGRLLKEQPGRWTVIRLPAIAEEGDVLGRAVGDALCPERYPANVLEEIMGPNGLGPRISAGLYQQRPSPKSGGILKREHWRRFSMDPQTLKFDDALLSVDATFKETADGSFVVFLVIARRDRDFYLLDRFRARMDFAACKSALKAFADKWPQVHERLIENKANGPAIVSDLRSVLGGLTEWTPQGKVAQANAVQPYLEGGNLYLPDGVPWASEFIEECHTFPNGANDDQVDALTQGVLRLLLKERRGGRKIKLSPDAMSGLSRFSPYDQVDGFDSAANS